MSDPDSTPARRAAEEIQSAVGKTINLCVEKAAVDTARQLGHTIKFELATPYEEALKKTSFSEMIFEIISDHYTPIITARDKRIAELETIVREGDDRHMMLSKLLASDLRQ